MLHGFAFSRVSLKSTRNWRFQIGVAVSDTQECLPHRRQDSEPSGLPAMEKGDAPDASLWAVAPLKVKVQWECSRGSLRREASSPFGERRGPGDGRLGAGSGSRLASTWMPAEDAPEATVQ